VSLTTAIIVCLNVPWMSRVVWFSPNAKTVKDNMLSCFYDSQQMEKQMKNSLYTTGGKEG
jgi:hypothetical protein